VDRLDLADDHVMMGRLPPDVAPDFEALWALHPPTFHEITMMGRRVRTPRWQQAYGRDYRYTGNVNRALPVPELLAPIATWARQALHPELDGLLVNWYEPALGHYIGPHRDRVEALRPGAPIVTISLGGIRTFRFRPWRPRTAPGIDPRRSVDLELRDQTVLVVPLDTNRRWTHEVLRRAGDVGRRVSVTLRAFA